jgi:hypothetical protein
MLLGGTNWLVLNATAAELPARGQSPSGIQDQIRLRQVQAAIIRCLPQRGNSQKYCFASFVRSMAGK